MGTPQAPGWGRAYLLGGISLILLIVLGCVSYLNIRTLDQNNDRETHSQTVLTQIERLAWNVTRAEAGQRGYLLTGDESYLQPYNESAALVNLDIRNLRDLIHDNPDQEGRLDKVQSAVTVKLDELAETIQKRREGGLDAALQTVLTGQGKQAMERVGKAIGDMQGAERELLQQRSEESQTS